MKSTTQSDLWTVGFGELAATLKVLQDHGITPSHLERLRAEPDYAKRVAEFMLRRDLDASTYQMLAARAVIGRNLFGVQDWSDSYDISFSQEQLCQITKFPWGEDVVNSTCPLCGKVIKNCHFAFLGLDRINGKPFTLLEWEKLHHYPRLDIYDTWWHDKNLPNTTMDLRWYLLHQEIVPKSENKTYSKQVRMLTADYEVPSGIAEVTKDLLVFRKTGKFVNDLQKARCECFGLDGVFRICVGGFDVHGLTANRWARDDMRDEYIGVGASRLLPRRQGSSEP